MSEFDWKLRLFVSADIIGSTQFKNRGDGFDSFEWAATFKEFVKGFPETVATHYHRHSLKEDTYPNVSEQLRPWKFSGDEMLFCAVLHEHVEILTHLRVFADAVSQYEFKLKGYENSNSTRPLKLKACAWLAGFPVKHVVVRLPHGQADNLVDDFIGPYIDLGFRLTKFASERKFVLTADVAKMVLDALRTRKMNPQEFPLSFHGRQKLKGIPLEEGYPIIWLDMVHDEMPLEEKAVGLSSREHLESFIVEFLKTNDWQHHPFIEGDSHADYESIPSRYEELRKRLISSESTMGENMSEQAPPETGHPQFPRLPDPPPRA